MENTLLNEDDDGFKDFQSMDPALARKKERNSSGDNGAGTPRSRAQSYSVHRKISPTERERANSFCQLKSSKYLERVRMRKEQNAVPELFSVVQEEKACTPLETAKLSAIPHKFSRSASLCGDSPPNASQFYEVLFLGKIKASHKRAPPTFIDEALQKFQQREVLKEQRKNSMVEEKIVLPTAGTPLQSTPQHPLDRTVSQNKAISVSTPNTVSSLASSTHNRTMLLQIGRTDLRLISPDKRQVLLHKSFKEISHCSCGQQNKEHFGFICREGHSGAPGQASYLGYVFRCDSRSVVEDIMQGLRSAFQSAHEVSRKERAEQSCPLCPLVWFNTLCEDMEGLPPSKAQGVVLTSLERLEEKERETILAKMSGAETPDISEQNQVLMMLLKATCEVKQETHQHSAAVNSTPANPAVDFSSTFITPALNDNNVLEAAKRAKRSLAESFNGIIRRKASVDVSEGSLLPLLSVTQASPVKKSAMPHPLSISNAERRLLQEKCSTPDRTLCTSPNKMDPLTPSKHAQFECDLGPSPGATRQRARTVGAAGGETMKRELARKRLARLKEETVHEEESSMAISKPSQMSPMISIFMKTGAKPALTQEGTFSSRQQIFQKVITPDKSQVPSSKLSPPGPRDYRLLWQNAIKQQILLVRMERENQKMLENEEHLAEKRLKLDYSDLSQGDQNSSTLWDQILTQPSSTIDSDTLREAVAKGIPQTRRGEAWLMLMSIASESSTNLANQDTSDKFPNISADYDVLKSQLTSHQHAILIDLGRTFPNHGYFSGALGPGQCGLFNLLKAYSILDPEVGYCQGLPFCVGMLLMHTEEEPAFQLLKHLMLTEGLRRQFNPDMTGLQVSMYQLTRLLAETHPSLYRQLDRLEVDPSLYATPWFLTLFAAHFPLGFVARVFDLIFLEGAAAIIRVGVCLMVECEDQISACNSLEELMTVLKVSLPSLEPSRLEDVVRQAASLNIARQLHTYEVEYQVLQEEQSSSRSQAKKTKEMLEAKEKEIASKDSLIANRDRTIVTLTQQVAEKDRIIAQLREDLEHRNNTNNNGAPREDDKLDRVLSLVEEINQEAPEEFRSKLDSVLSLGRESWSSRSNYQDGDATMIVDLDTTVSDIKDDTDVDDTNEDNGALGIPGRALKMLKLSPSFGSWGSFSRSNDDDDISPYKIGFW
eukprot:GFUD01139469.1.p1 GENE.GFUD01139469.1~~GFUD01139469.1.p1  ORF type:complete len:1170 (+),score=333.86 GFUD01139469.1:112-3621(+)